MNKKSGEYTQNEVEKTSGTRTLNAMLTLYSNASCSFCENRDVSVPIAWENRDRVQSNLIRRFATQPLRNWLAQLQQKQLRALAKEERKAEHARAVLPAQRCRGAVDVRAEPAL